MIVGSLSLIAFVSVRISGGELDKNRRDISCLTIARRIGLWDAIAVRGIGVITQRGVIALRLRLTPALPESQWHTNPPPSTLPLTTLMFQLSGWGAGSGLGSPLGSSRRN
jgi:hypothetical protein